MYSRFNAFILLLVCLVLSVPVRSESGSSSLSDFLSRPKAAQSRFLPVEQAFNVTGLRSGDRYTVNFGVTPGHYLYLNRISFVPSAGLQLPGSPHYNQQPVTEDDPDFGQVQVFDRDMEAQLAVRGSGRLTVHWQGCAKAGLCYPPQTTVLEARPVAVDGFADRTAAAGPLLATSDMLPAGGSSLAETARFLGVDPQPPVDAERLVLRWSVPNYFDPEDAFLTPLTSGRFSQPVPGADLSPARQCKVNLPEAQDAFGLASHPLLALGGIFVVGLLLCLTPCMLPMLPLVANMVARQHRRSASHGFALALAYVVGMAVSYALLGMLVAQFGQEINLVTWLQSPAILLTFATIFVLLGLISLGKFHLPLPAPLRRRLHAINDRGASFLGAGYTGSAVAGFLSAFVVSPCVSAPLAALLLSVSASGNVMMGALALFVFALGLGVPLLVLGASEGRLLPAPGPWMTWINRGFGLTMFAMALLMLERVYPSPLILAAWGVLALCVAYWCWQARAQGTTPLSRILPVVAATVVLGLAGAWFAGAALGNTDPLYPFNSRAARVNYPVYTSLEQIVPVIAANPRVVVDVTADWCVACAKMDRTLFAHPPAALQNWKVVKLDITRNTPQSAQALKELKLFGPPALVYYVDGRMAAKSEGEVSRQDFESYLHLCE